MVCSFSDKLGFRIADYNPGMQPNWVRNISDVPLRLYNLVLVILGGPLLVPPFRHSLLFASKV